MGSGKDRKVDAKKVDLGWQLEVKDGAKRKELFQTEATICADMCKAPTAPRNLQGV